MATVIMVHGAFCAGWAFDAFKAPFQAAGHRCLTPDLPGHGPGETPAGFSMTDYARGLSGLIDNCAEPPIVVGHSLGGLVAMMAAQKARPSALVLIAPSAPWGVQTTSMEDAATAVGLMGLNAYWTQAIEPDRTVFETYSGNRLDPETRREVYSRLTPESGRALSETMNWWMDPFMTTNVAGSQLKAPLLVLGGGQDRLHPPAQTRQIADRFGAEFQLFPEMGHWMIGEPGCEAVAKACLDWLDGAVKAAA